MERREFYSKKLKLAGWLCVCLAFVAGAFFESQGGSGFERVGGWFCIILFCLFGVIILNELVRSSPRVVLSASGLFDRSLGTPVIPWQSIVDMDSSNLKKSGYITLKLADEAQRVANLSVQRRALVAWQKMTGGGIFNTSISTLDAPANEVAAAILMFRQYYASKS